MEIAIKARYPWPTMGLSVNRGVTIHSFGAGTGPAIGPTKRATTVEILTTMRVDLGVWYTNRRLNIATFQDVNIAKPGVPAVLQWPKISLNKL
ncbi:hypothetical protein X801_07895 [Opisthorchis viverrini]|uniref:Uncharacterized protein n=1 Tax=Opisthorchis viverrini TaxID=6198 RepID=A0A1S8WPF7_OPIVI|nr:hypothetical protein X801_07895 [Opisthorchis viverrini]